MLPDSGFGCPWAARQYGIRNSLVLIVPVATSGAHDRAKLDPDKMYLHRRQNAPQFYIAGDTGEGPIKIIPRNRIFGGPTGRIKRIDRFKRSDHSRGSTWSLNPHRGKPGGYPDQSVDYDQNVDRLLDFQHSHLSPALQRQVDDTGRGQTIERFAHGAAAHAVRCGQLGFDQSLAGLESPVIKAANDRADDELTGAVALIQRPAVATPPAPACRDSRRGSAA
jgi:hypothetical protein